MFRISVITLLICACVSFSYAQDSLKKTKSVVKPATPYKNYKYHTYKYNPAKVAPGAVGTPVQPVPPVRHDSISTAIPVLDKNLNSQYQYLLSKIYYYQRPLVSAIWKNVSDSLVVNSRKLNEARRKLTLQSKTIDSLKADATSKDQTLNASNARVDEVDLLGIPMSKMAYNLLMWGLVIAFGITAGVVIARSGSYTREARYRTQLYNELEEEFKAYKTKANDKEKKLARELQTERNKLDELLGKG